jgi:hypothetical protein
LKRAEKIDKRLSEELKPINEKLTIIKKIKTHIDEP